MAAVNFSEVSGGLSLFLTKLFSRSRTRNKYLNLLHESVLLAISIIVLNEW